MKETYQIKHYPDGSSYVEIPESWAGDVVSLTFRINTYTDLWHLVQLCEVLTYNNCTAKILIPNLLGAQADRRFKSNQSSDLHKIASMLNEFEDIYFEIFHPHNPELVEGIFSQVTIRDNSQFIGEVLTWIEVFYQKPDYKKHINNLILMSSDAGGFKPLMKLCDTISWKGDTSSASKARLRDGTMVQRISETDFEGKDILIVDDICVYGGTFKGLSKLLRERNCGNLYLAVSHMTVQNLKNNPVTDYFDKVFTTDSKFTEYTFIDEELHTLTHEKLMIVPIED